jgi:hypothetical protein
MSLPAEFYEGVNVSPQKLEIETACAATCQPSLEGYRGCQSRLTPALIKEGALAPLRRLALFFTPLFARTQLRARLPGLLALRGRVLGQEAVLQAQVKSTVLCEEGFGPSRLGVSECCQGREGEAEESGLSRALDFSCPAA